MGVHKGGFSKGGFSNNDILLTHKLLKPLLLNPPLRTPEACPRGFEYGSSYYPARVIVQEHYHLRFSNAEELPRLLSLSLYIYIERERLTYMYIYIYIYVYTYIYIYIYVTSCRGCCASTSSRRPRRTGCCFIASHELYNNISCTSSYMTYI